MTKRERRWAKPKIKSRVEPKTEQPGLFAGTPGDRSLDNGIHCQAEGTRIDTAACIVQQSREPGKCIGCGHFKS